MWSLSHTVHGALSDGGGGGDDAQESLNVSQCNKVSQSASELNKVLSTVIHCVRKTSSMLPRLSRLLCWS